VAEWEEWTIPLQEFADNQYSACFRMHEINSEVDEAS